LTICVQQNWVIAVKKIAAAFNLLIKNTDFSNSSRLKKSLAVNKKLPKSMLLLYDLKLKPVTARRSTEVLGKPLTRDLVLMGFQS
jgi:stress-induced morphogen